MTTTTLPLAPGLWTLDRPHCSVEFAVRHMAISKVRGRFKSFAADIFVGPSLDESNLRATIDLGSVDTNNPDRDSHLKNSDFFNVERHPEMTFQSTTISEVGDGEYAITGDLMINGVTRTETLSATFHGTETFPGDSSLHAGFEAKASIKRMDYGIDFNVPLGAGGFVISDEIEIELDIQLLAPKNGATT